MSNPPPDVLIVGGGPAGSMAALVLARRGARVTLVDRAWFPRDKLCGDSVNPGAMALLGRQGLASAVAARGLPIPGWLLTGPGGAAVPVRYPDGAAGCSILRRDLDALLLDAAAAAGAAVEQGTRVAGPLVDRTREGERVVGVRVQAGRGLIDRRARVVIAADGSRSALAAGLGLARQASWPRRWAIGAYYSGVVPASPGGEMHLRRGHYIGVAPVPGGLTRVCLVVPAHRARAIGAAAGHALDLVLAADHQLGARFREAHRASPVASLGPLATDAFAAGMEGLLLAGDAAGFVDPMTGDGLRLALGGGELAAAAALEALEGRSGAHLRLAARRRRELGVKLRFNRALRALVSAPAGVSLAALVGRCWPGVLAPVVCYAGDVGVAGRGPGPGD